MAKSNHIDNNSNIRMVDIGNKASTKRKAIASKYLFKQRGFEINKRWNK